LKNAAATILTGITKLTGEEDIVRALKEDPSAYHSGQHLAQSLGVSRTTVWKRIRKLRKLGFKIEGSPSLGYRLAGLTDLLDPDFVRRLLKTRIIGKRIDYRPITVSTNTDAFALARGDAPEGTCVLADVQTGGRGRLGRKWLAPPGGAILTSVILRPRIPPVHAPMITLAAGVAVNRAIRRVTDLDPHIKWPNDILIGDRKVAGILTEMAAESDRVHFVIVGIGVNVNLEMKDMPDEILQIATSLKIETGRAVSRNYLLISLYQEIEGAYRRFVQQGPPAIVEEWENLARIRGRAISATTATGAKVAGTAIGLDDDGALLIKTGGGAIYRINAGDVVFQ